MVIVPAARALWDPGRVVARRASREVVQDPVEDLRRRLAQISPGEGGPVELAPLRRCVRAWWKAHELGAHPAIVGKRVALALLDERASAGRRAGMLVLAEQLGAQLRAADLADCARLFDGDALAEPGLVELFARTVLTTLLVHAPGRRDAVRALASWRDAPAADQRRAACLGLAGLVASPVTELTGIIEPCLGVCATLAWSPAPLEQRAVATLLRALSAAEPSHVDAFVRRRGHLLSRAAVRRAVGALPADRRAALLAHHLRAVTARRVLAR